MMGTFKYLEHTADLMIEGGGRSPSDALEGLATGLIEALGGGPDEARALSARTVSVRGSDEAETVVNALTEIIYITLAEGFVPCRAAVGELNASRAELTLLGEGFDPARHALKEVKAATFHGFASGPDGSGGYFVKVLFDT